MASVERQYPEWCCFHAAWSLLFTPLPGAQLCEQGRNGSETFAAHDAAEPHQQHCPFQPEVRRGLEVLESIEYTAR
ncbi:hypothetical protein DAT35_26790 [Vitiosangium sp. GDMCC 1.1324]|nr:hypothetical protein DAT35_26790 [Vitiosangium sp. GDMCC 1.1324]